MTDELDLGRVKLPVPDGAGQVSELLQRGELWCGDLGPPVSARSAPGAGGRVAGERVRDPRRAAGVPPEEVPALCDEFAARLEVYREPEGIPLDFELAGVVAARLRERRQAPQRGLDVDRVGFSADRAATNCTWRHPCYLSETARVELRVRGAIDLARAGLHGDERPGRQADQR